jgi:hypothetical protein
MPCLPEKLLLLAVLVAVPFGCKPKIGDDCRISTDCSAAGDRLCDITEPGGYCTVFNCEPGTCPEDESLCVEFGSQRSVDDSCQSSQSPSPYARSFCMATCDGDSDCRSGYVCRDVSREGNEWGAVLIDHDRGHKACVVKSQRVDQVAGGDFGVCETEAPGQVTEVPGQGGAGG